MPATAAIEPLTLPAATQAVYEALHGIDDEDRLRVLRAAIALLGVEATVEAA